jgi:uncharacterized protein YjdB
MKIKLKKTRIMRKFTLLIATLLCLSALRSAAQPIVAATTPPVRNSGDVISLFSEAYTNVAGTNWFPNWGQTTIVTDYVVAGNTTKKYATLNYQGVQFSAPVNASSMTNLHIDVWTTNVTAFDIFLINTTPSLFEKKVTINPTASGWSSFDIPLTSYAGVALNNIGQMKLVGTPSGGTIYMDNMYFWKSSSIPTITGFNIPEHFVGDAPFALTDPTSNSTGAFTYSSSNTSVATVSGRTVTILAAGSSTITATQAPAGSYSSGTATATLVVSYPPPTTAAPTPPARVAADYVSLFSEAYTNVAGIDWFPNWGQATVVSEVLIAGNATKKYFNLNYQGVQFGTAVNAAAMQKLHVDIWTPNCTAFDLYLINTSPTTREQKVTLNPTLSGWNSFDIPLSSYSTINLSSINQFKLMGTPSGTSLVYMDNMYFWKASNAPTITGFTVPAKVLGDAPFTITQPTSNSTGAFTYTSSNPAVATITGNVITITGVGTSTITANQAAAGAYTSGSASTAFVVTYPGPSTAAPTPPIRNVADYKSLYSDSYLNLAGTDWNPNWGQSTIVTDVTIAGNATKKYDNLNYQGAQLASDIDVSAMQKLHIDVWTPNCTALDLYLINTNPTTVEQKVTLTPTLSGWNSFDIALTQYTTISLTNINQIKFVGTPSGTSVVYWDNLYFWKSSNAPTLTNFSIPAQNWGGSPFTITPPTSNSTGTFTYTSSNPLVATVSGNVITVVGVGSTVITATQSPSGSYSSGTIATTLTVSVAPPLTAAPTPPARNAADVVSLFSDTYTSVAGTLWTPNWGQSTIVTDLQIAGNNTRKYENLNYQGVELAGPVNVSQMTKMHLDIWTPNCTAFDVYLINTVPATVEEKVTLTPTLSGWNSFDINMSLYDTINLSAVTQIKFVGLPFGTSHLFYDNFYFWRPAGTVPVTLLSFDAKKSGKKALITWTTTNEINNRFFQVERSNDGNEWKVIETAMPIPATNGLSQYQIMDRAPMAGVNYYRLKQVDMDGSYRYSPIKTINFSKNEIVPFVFYPNPVAENLKIQTNLTSPGKMKIQIFDAIGRNVKTWTSISATQLQLSGLDLSSLQPGVYELRIIQDASSYNSQFIKQ